MMKDEDGLLQNTKGAGDTEYFFTVFNYDYKLDLNNEINVQLYYAHYKDIFNLDRLEDISGYLSFTNSYGNVDFYNGVVWHQNSLDWKNYFDLTSSISWKVNEHLTVTLKGQNLLDKAKKTDLYRVDPVTYTPMEPLKITPIDQRVILELEYLF
ncbi:MAG: hypothetical protein ABXS92_00255 [Sulfurimonas sp.]